MSETHQIDLSETEDEIGRDNVKVLGLDIHNPVFLMSSVLILMFVIGTLIYPEAAKEMLDGAKGWSIQHFDWLFIWGANLFVIFCIPLLYTKKAKDRPTTA